MFSGFHLQMLVTYPVGQQPVKLELNWTGNLAEDKFGSGELINVIGTI